MEKYEYLIIIILIILSIVINVFYNKSQKIYFFFDAKDEKSVKLLSNILKNSDNEIVIVTSEKEENEHNMREVLQKLSSVRPVSKVLNIEKLTDLSEVVYEACFKNAKCIFQPHDRFYAIANRLNVQGYPFQFENKIDSPSNIPSDVNGNASVNYGNSDKNIDLLSGNKNASVGKLKELVEGPGGCSNTRSSRGLGE
jgi:ATP-dependent Lon protease